MDLLQEGIEPVTIALWLGHESVETTQIYLDANLALKQAVLDKTTPPEGKPGQSVVGACVTGPAATQDRMSDIGVKCLTAPLRRFPDAAALQSALRLVESGQIDVPGLDTARAWYLSQSHTTRAVELAHSVVPRACGAAGVTVTPYAGSSAWAYGPRRRAAAGSRS